MVGGPGEKPTCTCSPSRPYIQLTSSPPEASVRPRAPPSSTSRRVLTSSSQRGSAAPIINSGKNKSNLGVCPFYVSSYAWVREPTRSQLTVCSLGSGGAEPTRRDQDLDLNPDDGRRRRRRPSHGEGGEAGAGGCRGGGEAAAGDRGGVLGAGLPALPVAGRQFLPQGRHGRRRLLAADPPGLRQPAHGRQAAPWPHLRCRPHTRTSPSALRRHRRYALLALLFYYPVVLSISCLDPEPTSAVTNSRRHYSHPTFPGLNLTHCSQILILGIVCHQDGILLIFVVQKT